MNMLVRPPRFTPDEFETMRGTEGYELIDGYPREKAMGMESSAVQLEIGARLREVVRPARLGLVFGSECMYQCFPTRPRSVRKPDVSFVRQDRLPVGGRPPEMSRVRPDLVAEVISLHDLYEDVEAKLADYFDAGVPLIWVVTPKTRTVLVYRADGTARRLTEADELTADPVIPGFSVKVADLFPFPRPAADDAPEPTPEG